MSTDQSAAEAGPVDIFGLVGTVLDRKFRIDKLVAEGGFGVVYFGTHLTLEKPVAVKVLKTPPEFNDKARAQFIEKFALEGKTMARISHPNIVQVLDFGASPMPSGDMAPWMVLEWLTGQTLEHMLLSRRGQHKYTPEETFTIVRPVLEALAYAHDEAIAHRDIKPANMMVVQGKRGSTLRLMDFGIAKLMEEGEGAGSGATRTRTTMNAFSPQYAAPEQISGTRTGPWTDVHAMALIMTEMLTDQAPYEGDDMTSLFGQILSPLRPTPGRRGVDVGAWEPILARALTMKPDERYKNAAEFLTALEAAMPNGRAMGSITGAFKAVQDQPVPAGVVPGPSPTTLRGSAVSTNVTPPVTSSRTPAILGGSVVLALCAVGAIIAVSKSHSPPPPVVTTAPPVHGNAAGGGAVPVHTTDSVPTANVTGTTNAAGANGTTAGTTGAGNTANGGTQQAADSHDGSSGNTASNTGGSAGSHGSNANDSHSGGQHSTATAHNTTQHTTTHHTAGNSGGGHHLPIELE